jgi:hypothetical protein
VHAADMGIESLSIKMWRRRSHEAKNGRFAQSRTGLIASFSCQSVELCHFRQIVDWQNGAGTRRKP